MYPSDVATASLDVSVVLPCYTKRDHIELEIKRIKAALETPACALPRNQGAARPALSAPSRPPAGWWSGPTPT